MKNLLDIDIKKKQLETRVFGVGPADMLVTSTVELVLKGLNYFHDN
jgi:hypothetical protein